MCCSWLIIQVKVNHFPHTINSNLCYTNEGFQLCRCVRSAWPLMPMFQLNISIDNPLFDPLYQDADQEINDIKYKSCQFKDVHAVIWTGMLHPHERNFFLFPTYTYYCNGTFIMFISKTSGWLANTMHGLIKISYRGLFLITWQWLFIANIMNNFVSTIQTAMVIGS